MLTDVQGCVQMVLRIFRGWVVYVVPARAACVAVSSGLLGYAKAQRLVRSGPCRRGSLTVAQQCGLNLQWLGNSPLPDMLLRVLQGRQWKQVLQPGNPTPTALSAPGLHKRWQAQRLLGSLILLLPPGRRI